MTNKEKVIRYRKDIKICLEDLKHIKDLRLKKDVRNIINYFYFKMHECILEIKKEKQKI